jgi:hypothetical protein
MVSSGLVRRTAVAVCAGGIAGMIVSSILNHNGAAITFGLITAAAVLCSMVATAVAADVTRQLSGSGALPGPLLAVAPAAREGETGGDDLVEPASSRAPIRMGHETEVGAEEQAALVERLVEGLVETGTEDAALRDVVRESVRLGRILAAR